MKTHNVLKIDSVSIVPKKDDHGFICLDVELKSKLEAMTEAEFKTFKKSK